MAQGSRAKYFATRREKYKLFSAEVEVSKLEQFYRVLKSSGTTKTKWINEKIDEVLAQNE